jgi:phosphoribosyl-ATP pyrophosphohydrolase/phosphoribosyl-AMP cyclohydrolase
VTVPVPFDAGAVRFAADGLVPAVVQDRRDGRVLMVAYMDAAALSATLATGEVHFHSRSRGTLWRKGETSGNVLRLVGLALDCDGDALLVAADPVGPTCHRGTRSCFDPTGAPATVDDTRAPAGSTGSIEGGASADAVERSVPPDPSVPATAGFAWLETLWVTIASRAAERPEGSYTARLLEGGVDAVARKVTEEATEVLLAAKDDAVAEVSASAGPDPGDPGASRAATRAALAGETADLLYHTLVLLAERDLDPATVIEALRARHR